MSPAIEVHQLYKSFGGVDAVQGISFQIAPGQVVGFIGANGAGKTTTMRIMATLEMPTRGEVRVAGHDVTAFPAEVRARVGWMPDSYGAYAHVTAAEYLDFFARAFGYTGAERRARVQETLRFTELMPLAEREMAKLSKGQSQRLCLARALLNDPAVLILDEPAAGLDPKARTEFKRLVRLLAEEEKTVFISSHILSELAEMCDTMLFIDQGRIVHHGTADSLVAEVREEHLVRVELTGEPAQLIQWAELAPGVRVVERYATGALLALHSGEGAELATALKRMIEAGLPVVEFHRQEASLEDAFVQHLAARERNKP